MRVVQPDVAATTGATLRIEGDLSLRANIDVGNRAFELLDTAQISFVLKEQAYRALDGRLDQVIAELTTLDLPPTLRAH